MEQAEGIEFIKKVFRGEVEVVKTLNSKGPTVESEVRKLLADKNYTDSEIQSVLGFMMFQGMVSVEGDKFVSNIPSTKSIEKAIKKMEEVV
jgi:hypothetical protein